MSRSTTVVGLTDAARAFTAKLELLAIREGDQGMFGEPIAMGRWRDPDGHEYIEVTQDAPWSSGPCVFTCLEWRPRGEEPTMPPDEAAAKLRDALGLWSKRGATAEEAAGAEELLDAALQPPTLLFRWVIDPAVRDREWDRGRGVYWI